MSSFLEDKVNKYLIVLALLSVYSSSYAKDDSRKLLSAWSTDCENIEKSRWFALESHGDEKFMFTFCAGFRCIPYPGFWKPFDVYNDKRVKWISDTKMEVSNDDEEAGWEGYVAFNQCLVY